VTGPNPLTGRDPALLVFEDGYVARGQAFGARGEAYGEVVFNTAMTGYQEILTDPSYRGQLVLMTYPLIGNYGVNEQDVESRAVHTEGFIAREFSRVTSNHRATNSLDEYLKLHHVVGIDDVDTRAIVLHMRSRNAMRAVISSTDLDVDSLLQKVLKSPSLEGRDCVREVTRWQVEQWTEGHAAGFQLNGARRTGSRQRVVAYDFGIKNNILRSLVDVGFDVTIVPGHASAAEVLELKPDGVFLSNGPGDPEPVSYAVRTIQTFLEERIPTFGICLGHQLMALATGAKTYKMRFGHHGANQPVIDLATGKTEITCQNHSFAVDPDSLDDKLVRVSHKNLNDGTIEGLELLQSPAFSVQYHPEASPGPHDSLYLFERFRQLVVSQGRVPSATGRTYD